MARVQGHAESASWPRTATASSTSTGSRTRTPPAGSERTGAGSEYALESPTAWLFGNEAQGLSEEELALADHRVAVPVYGAAESLNLGTAATVCLYASARSQQDGRTRLTEPAGYAAGSRYRQGPGNRQAHAGKKVRRGSTERWAPAVVSVS